MPFNTVVEEGMVPMESPKNEKSQHSAASLQNQISALTEDNRRLREQLTERTQQFEELMHALEEHQKDSELLVNHVKRTVEELKKKLNH